MFLKRIAVGLLAVAAILGLTAGVSWSATPHGYKAPHCAVVHDTVTKTDNGHGTPAAWADLVLHRTTTVCKTGKGSYSVALNDSGTLYTRVDAGNPNGTGGTIQHRVAGTVKGSYHLTATGAYLPPHPHGDVSLSSTEYVKSLFKGDAVVVTGGTYGWTYTTVCKETWTDSSTNNDGQGAAAGSILGRQCRTHPRHPKPPHTPTPIPTGSATPAPTPTTPPGEAPVPVPVTGDPANLGVTG